MWIVSMVLLLLVPAGAEAAEWIVMTRGPRTSDPFDLDMHRVRLVQTPDDPVAARRALLARADVEWAEPNLPRALCVDALLPADPLLRDTRQWGIFNAGPGGAYGGIERADAHVVEAWQASPRPGRVRIAVADTGVDPHHPEFAPGGRIESAFDATGLLQSADSAGHGTMVAGIIAARVGDGARMDSLGMAGVCGGDGAALPECSILPIHITKGRSNLASSFAIARAIVHATDAGARVLNLSVAGAGRSRLERLALHYATVRGCIVVAASGNRGFLQEQQPMYPAAYSADGLCIQAGASTPFDTRATFSSYGHGVDVVAPGENIWSTWPTYPIGAATWPGYAVGSGTSFAAPFVTGAVGLLVAARPELRDRDAQELLRIAAHDIGPPGADPEYGAGRLDAGRALAAVGPGVAIWHDEIAATHFEALHADTLRIGEDGLGAFEAATTGRLATLFEVTATFSLPDSFAGDARVWPRVGGTSTVRAGHRLPYFAPWAEAERIGARTVRLRGYVYRAADQWIPLPPDQIRFGFTVVGPRRVPLQAANAPLRAHPNPFRSGTTIEGGSGAVLRVLDVSGRLVRELRPGKGGRVYWNAEAIPPGLYFIRAGTDARATTTRVVKLE